MARHSFGTNRRNSIDQGNLRKAATGVGTDLRYWVSFGTVATIDKQTGEMNPKDPHAIWNASDGVDVDVMLEPLGEHVTAKYAGEQAGEVTVLSPIRPGDLVLVECPDGDLTTPVITKILHSRSNRQPTDNGKPVFDNNRHLVFAKSVPIDIRTAGGVQVLLEQDGTATITAKLTKIGDDSAHESAVFGDAQKGVLQDFADAITSYADEISGTADPTGLATAGLVYAAEQFKAALAACLSKKVKVS